MDNEKSRLSKAVIFGAIAFLVVLVLLWPYSFGVHPAISSVLGIITGIFSAVITYLILNPKRTKERSITITFIIASLVLFYFMSVLLDFIIGATLLKLSTQTLILSPIFIYVLAQIIPFVAGAGGIILLYGSMEKLANKKEY